MLGDRTVYAAQRSVRRVDQADDLRVAGRGQRFRREGFRRYVVGYEDENRIFVPRFPARGLHETAQCEVGVRHAFVYLGFSFRQRRGVFFRNDERVVRTERESRCEKRLRRFGQHAAHVL